MNVKIGKTIDGLKKSEKEKIHKYIREKGMEVYNEEASELMRRCFKIICVSLNEKYGFGKIRLINLFDDFKLVSEKRNKDEVFWKHIDDICIEQIKIPFERENYDDLDK